MNFRMLIFAFLLAASSAMATTHDWPRFRGPLGDGSWNPPSLPGDLASIQPEQRWSVKIGGGYGGVTVSEGRVYVMDRIKQPEAERVLCLDETTGKQLWEYQYPVTYGSIDYGNGPRGSVIIDQGKAYTMGTTGVALCLDAATGKVIWNVDLVKDHGAVIPTWGFAASPFLWDGAVLLHCGAQPDGTIIAVEAPTGKLRWRGGSDKAGYCTPMVIDAPSGPMVIQWGPQSITGMSPKNGEEHWKFPYEITYGVSIAQPIYHEGILLVSGYWHGTRALKLGSGPQDVSLVWSDEKTLCGLMSQPLYKDGYVYLLTKAQGVICFRLSDGEIQWKDDHQLTPKDRNPQISLVWADEKKNIVCGLNAMGELIFAKFTPEKMEEITRHQVIGRTWAHPAYTKGAVFARSDTEIAAWDLWK